MVREIELAQRTFRDETLDATPCRCAGDHPPTTRANAAPYEQSPGSPSLTADSTASPSPIGWPAEGD